MKDVLGVEIEIGDELVYASSPYQSVRLTFGTVISVTERSARIKRTLAPGVKDGIAQKWCWDASTNTGHHEPVPATATTIGAPSRCMIIRKHTS